MSLFLPKLHYKQLSLLTPLCGVHFLCLVSRQNVLHTAPGVLVCPGPKTLCYVKVLKNPDKSYYFNGLLLKS